MMNQIVIALVTKSASSTRLSSISRRAGALGLLADDDDGNPQRRRLLLNASGIRDDERGLRHQAHEAVVRHGLEQRDALVAAEALVHGTAHVRIQMYGIDDVRFGMAAND